MIYYIDYGTYESPLVIKNSKIIWIYKARRFMTNNDTIELKLKLLIDELKREKEIRRNELKV